MPLFGAPKPTATVAEYARWFHTSDARSGETLGIGPGAVQAAYVKVITDLVTQQDARFGRTDLQLFNAEFTALRAEIFGIAWGHAFHGKDRHLLGEGQIAKEVLTQLRVWDRTQKYNSAVAQSRDAMLPQGERMRRGAITFQNSLRVSMALRWKKLGIDDDVIVQVASRVFTEESWKSGLTLRYLTAELIQALGFAIHAGGESDLSEDAIGAIQVPLLDIYVGSRENLARYNIKPD